VDHKFIYTTLFSRIGTVDFAGYIIMPFGFKYAMPLEPCMRTNFFGKIKHMNTTPYFPTSARWILNISGFAL